MRVADALRMALQVPLANPGRSVLTTLGLAIGVGAFIAMVSFAQGASDSVVAQFETLGSNLLRVQPLRRSDGALARPLTLDDVAALQREATTLAHVVPHADRPTTVTRAGRVHRMRVRGTTPGFLRMQQYRIQSGGSFDQRDMAQRRKVCLIGGTLVQALFAGEEALGGLLTIDGRMSCRVIGVFAERGSAISGRDMDDLLFMPLTTLQAHLGMPAGLAVIELRPKSPEMQPAARDEVTQVLRRLHRLEPQESDDFEILSPDLLTDTARKVSTLLSGLLAGIAAVSLLVGGIGIMNLQLVAVSERTQEIGIRLAIGGSPAQIMRQFLTEALVLATIGSAAGVALGVGASVLVARQLGWPAFASLPVVGFSAAFGLAVGTLFGWLPAKRAAALDPVDALRSGE